MANNTNQATYQHQRRTLFLICLGFFFSIILLYKVLNPVVIITCLGIIAIRYGEVKRTISEHPAWLNNLLSVFIIATIVALLTLYGFRTYLVNAFINLLVGSIALKFLEIRQERDLNIQVIALFFLSSLTFVFSYDWYMLLYMMLCLIIDFAALMSLSACRPLRHLFKYSVKTVLMAVPLAAVLFVVLPRFNPFWQMPNATQHQTGLGDEVGFASIGELLQDHSLAFRAVFDGKSILSSIRLSRAFSFLKICGDTRTPLPRLPDRNSMKDLILRGLWAPSTISIWSRATAAGSLHLRYPPHRMRIYS